MSTFLHWLISALVIVLAAMLVPGVSVTLVGALLAAIVLGLINLFLKPLIVILTLPINILTLGLFTFVINAFLVILTMNLVKGFQVDGFLWALLFSLVLSVISTILRGLVK